VALLSSETKTRRAREERTPQGKCGSILAVRANDVHRWRKKELAETTQRVKTALGRERVEWKMCADQSNHLFRPHAYQDSANCTHKFRFHSFSFAHVSSDTSRRPQGFSRTESGGIIYRGSYIAGLRARALPYYNTLIQHGCDVALSIAGPLLLLLVLGWVCILCSAATPNGGIKVVAAP